MRLPGRRRAQKKFGDKSVRWCSQLCDVCNCVVFTIVWCACARWPFQLCGGNFSTVMLFRLKLEKSYEEHWCRSCLFLFPFSNLLPIWSVDEKTFLNNVQLSSSNMHEIALFSWQSSQLHFSQIDWQRMEQEQDTLSLTCLALPGQPWCYRAGWRRYRRPHRGPRSECKRRPHRQTTPQTPLLGSSGWLSGWHLRMIVFLSALETNTNVTEFRLSPKTCSATTGFRRQAAVGRVR